MIFLKIFGWMALCGMFIQGFPEAEAGIAAISIGGVVLLVQHHIQKKKGR